MRCYQCGGRTTRRKATIDAPYAYSLSGLRGVFLCGIQVHACSKCNAEAPVIPKIEELHRVIASEIVREPRPLRGDEIRFLRKNAGFPARKFATLLGVSPEHLSRVENGHSKSLGTPADRLARLLVTAAGGAADVRRLLLDMADRLEAERSISVVKQPVFELDKNHWRVAA